MKIISLYINNYKNINGQTLTFPEKLSYVTLIGLNGSGKSNFMEATSMIFSAYYRGGKNRIGFEYKLSYALSNGSKYELSNDADQKDGNEVKITKADLPDKVIACYSGESLRLWQTAYRESYEEFFNKAVDNEYEEPSMLYVNKYAWTLSLVSLMCSNDIHVKEFLKEHFGIEDLSQVKVHVEFDEDNLGAYKNNEVKDFLNRIRANNGDWYMSELSTMDLGNRLEPGTREFCRHIFFYLYLASMPKRNNVNRIEAAIKEIGISINGISSNNISEGEKKLFLIECITKLLGSYDSVLILDEPDAHVHVSNKDQICAMCKSFEGQTILSTHSPYVINDVDYESLRYIDKGVVKPIDNIHKLTTEITDGSFGILDGTILMENKQLIVTEGPYDIKYIKRAVELLSQDNSLYKKITNTVSFVFQGSANETSEFFESAIMPVLDMLDKVLFIFDADADGKKNGQRGYQSISAIKQTYGNKLDAIFYSESYPISDINNPKPCYIENFFPISKDIEDIFRNGHTPLTFSEIREAKERADSMKKSLKKNYRKYSKNELAKFRPLLDEIIRIFNL